MKKLSVTAILALFIILSACEKEKAEQKNNNLSILGKWKLDRTVEEDYHPINTLTDREEIIGNAGDSIVFRADMTAVVYEDDGSMEETDYQFLNDNTIMMEFEIFKIRKLTDTELYLHEEEIDQSANEKWVYQIHLKR